MADPVARSPLEGIAAADRGGVALAERRFPGMLDLRFDPANDGARQAAEAALGLALPAQPNRCSARGGHAALWLAPGEFLVVTEPGEESALAAALAGALDPHPAAVTDVSDARAVIELAGPRARDLLAKGCPLDLHPRVFAPGHCAQSRLAKALIILWQLDDEPRFRLLVERSLAEYLWFWLEDAAAEFRAAPQAP